MDDSTPAVRVAWSTTAPSQCVTVVRVEFKTSIRGPVVTTYTTTNTSQTEIIHSLQCATNYYIRVVVAGVTSVGVQVTVNSGEVQVFVGGKGIVCMRYLQVNNMMVALPLYRYT